MGNERSVTVGRGARSFPDLDSLLKRQWESAWFILKGLGDCAREAMTYSGRCGKLASDLDACRPHQVFTLDGARGMGKTTTLLTILKKVKGAERVARAGMGATDCCENVGGVEDEATWIGPLSDRGIAIAPAVVLPVISPHQMEGSDSVMEAVFARIDHLLDEEVQKEAQPERRNRLKKLQDALRRDVSAGWAFSHDFGMETLGRDSIDYDDFVERRFGAMVRGDRRIGEWRKFVCDLLDALGCATLLISIDDTDLAPSIGRDILEALRVYLPHPRIVTLLCVDFEAFERGLFQQDAAAIRRAVEVCPEKEREEWLENKRDALRHTLDKLMPVGLFKSLRLVGGDVDRLWKTLQMEISGTPPDQTTSWTEFLFERIAVAGGDAEAWRWWIYLLAGKEGLAELNVRELIVVLEMILRSKGRLSPQEAVAKVSTSRGRALTRMTAGGLQDGVEPHRLLSAVDGASINWERGVVRVAGDTRWIIGRETPEFIVLMGELDRSSVWLRRAGGESEDRRREAEGRLRSLLPSSSILRMEGLGPLETVESQRLGVARLYPRSSIPINFLLASDWLSMAPGELATREPQRNLADFDWAPAGERKERKNSPKLTETISLFPFEGDPIAVVRGIRQAFLINNPRNFVSDAEARTAVLPAVHLVWTIASRREPLVGEDVGIWSGAFERAVRSLDSRPKEHEAFASVMEDVRRFLQSEGSVIETLSRLNRNALVIATKGSSIGPEASPAQLLLQMGILREHDRSRVRPERRAWVLLAWALSSTLESVLEREGWRKSKEGGRSIEDWRSLAKELNDAALWLKCALPEQKEDQAVAQHHVDLLMKDFTKQELRGVVERLESAAKAIRSATSSRRRSRYRVPETMENPFDLRTDEQIAFVLGITPARAKVLIEKLKGT